MEFVLTSDVTLDDSTLTHQFETFPDMLSLDFLKEKRDSGILKTYNNMLKNTMKSIYGDDSLPESIIVVELLIKATIKVDNDEIILPYRRMNVQVDGDGSLKWHEKKNSQ